MYRIKRTGRSVLPSAVVCILALALAACAGAGDIQSPASPGISSQSVRPAPGTEPNRWLWGFWEGYISSSHDEIELIPVRSVDLHLNARRLLENTVCKTCLTVLSKEIDPDGVMKVLIQLTHPFPGIDRYTGFDVRGIVISDGSRYFPTLDARVPDSSLGDFTLVNPDGYTRMWNTVDFPPGSGPFKILEYSQGKYASPGSFTGTVNPYIEFKQDPRSCFPAGAVISREFDLKLVPGGIKFGYAVDASWEAPTVDPPVDLMIDFPESANAPEPYYITSVQSELLGDQAGDTASLSFEMADRQGDSMYTSTLLECPDLWTGTIEPDLWGATPGEPLWYPFAAIFTITNETGAAEGVYPAMFKIVDGALDPWLGDINHRYAPIWIQVKHKETPQLTGKLVFVAPGPPDPNGMPGAPNVFLMDVGTLQEDQLTGFHGVGAIFEEPRINPVGTHMLLNFCPTPYASKVDLYEIGTGTSWTASPSGVYDGNADFHPDGEHILVASGAQFDQTYDLVSMKYDGSERQVIATAPASIRNPRWSPDGKRIVMTLLDDPGNPMESSLWIYDTDTTMFTQLSPSGGLDEHPSWSPVEVGGSYLVAFDSNRNDPSGFGSDIFVVNPDTGELVYTLDTGANETHPSFSPDGLSIVYSADNIPGSDLYVYTFDGGQTVQLTFDDTFDSSPSWSWGW